MAGGERTLLLPAKTPGRAAVERALRKRGWELIAYDHAGEVEHALLQRPATAVALFISEADPKESGVLEVVRRLCPDAFVVGIGDGGGESGADAVLPATCTSKELIAAVQAGAAGHDDKILGSTLRKKLLETEQQAQFLAERIKELEDECLLLQTWLRTAEEHAFRDELTDLYNRRYFVKAAEMELDRARRGAARFSIAMVDIDHFKRYNDSYGHLKGDELLARLARVMLRNLRRMDTLARYGGEEFILLLPETASARQTKFDSLRAMERLRQAIERDETLNGESNLKAPITVSAGLVQYPEDGQTIGGLIEEADARLFRAKEAGRNRICAAPL
jgi:diguanylate cyclase (GGDEF)-like protein